MNSVDTPKGTRENKYRVDHKLKNVDTFIHASKYESSGGLVTFYEKDAMGNYIAFLTLKANDIYKIERRNDLKN